MIGIKSKQVKVYIVWNVIGNIYLYIYIWHYVRVYYYYVYVFVIN